MISETSASGETNRWVSRRNHDAVVLVDDVSVRLAVAPGHPRPGSLPKERVEAAREPAQRPVDDYLPVLAVVGVRLSVRHDE